MTCPRCLAEFEHSSAKCPECGVHLLRNVSGVIKTSAVMIAAAGEEGFYRSVQDIPEPLRTQLLEVTTSSNSGTILIADRAAKEQLEVTTERKESARSRAVSAAAGEPKARVLRAPWIFWAGMLLLLLAGGVTIAVFAIH